MPGRVGDGDGNTDDGNEELADTHPHGAPDEEGTTAKVFDAPHTGEGHEHIDDVGGNLGQEGILDTRVGEE